MDSFAGRRHAHALQSVPRKMEKEEGPKAFLCISACALLSLDSQDLAAIVGTASLASTVGSNGLAALGADGNAGSAQLPVGATALIAAGGRHFTLRNSHGDTSLVELLSNSLNNGITGSEAAVKQRIGDRSPSCSGSFHGSDSHRNRSTGRGSHHCTGTWCPCSG